MGDREMDTADRLFDGMRRLCADNPSADVMYALGMMVALTIKNNSDDALGSLKSIGEVVALELRSPRGRIHRPLPHC